MAADYTYAVARIRSKELSLLSGHDIDSLLSLPDYKSCLRALSDKGWNFPDNSDISHVLSIQTEELWELMDELVKDDNSFDIFRIRNDYHNLKVAVKAVTRSVSPESMLLKHSVYSPQQIVGALENRDYSQLPDILQEPAKEAMASLLQTADGQLCDIIIDRAALEHIYRLGMESDNDFIRRYAQLTVGCADIKTAVRSAKTSKSGEFIKKALCHCDCLNVDALAAAAVKGIDEICDCLTGTMFTSAVPYLKISVSAFEKWADNYLNSLMQEQKWDPFTIGPIAAYILGKEKEITAVRLILSGKLNGLSDSVIKERLRDMYV